MREIISLLEMDGQDKLVFLDGEERQPHGGEIIQIFFESSSWTYTPFSRVLNQGGGVIPNVRIYLCEVGFRVDSSLGISKGKVKRMSLLD